MKYLKTAFWFLKKPHYIPQIFQVLKRNKNKHLENSREESLSWCKENCVSQEVALQQILNIKDHENLTSLFPNEIKDAKNKADNCPVKMGGEGAISFLYHLVKESKSKSIIETGVAYGWSSLAILLAIKDTDNALLISNDMPYIKMNNDDYVGCVIPEELKGKWELQREADIKGIPLALKKVNNNIDLCHYDSDKSYTGRMFAYPLLWRALSKRGIFISDDIQDNIAFKEFCEAVNHTPIIIEHLDKYVGILMKKCND